MVEGGQGGVISGQHVGVKPARAPQGAQERLHPEPRRPTAGGQVGPVAAPAEGPRVADQPGLHRVPVDVAHHGPEVGVGVDTQGPVPAPEQGAIAAVGPVEPLRVNPIEVAHDPGEGGLRGAEDEVVVGVHEAVGIDLAAPERVGLGHGGQECRPVRGGAEDRLAGKAPVHDVIDGARVEDPEGTGHGGCVAHGPSTCQPTT